MLGQLFVTPGHLPLALQNALEALPAAVDAILDYLTDRYGEDHERVELWSGILDLTVNRGKALELADRLGMALRLNEGGAPIP